MSGQTTAMRKRRRLRLTLVGSDLASIVVALALAGLVRTQLNGVAGFSSVDLRQYVVASLLIIPSQLLLFKAVRLYDFDLILAGTGEYGRIAAAATYMLGLIVTVSYFAGGMPLVSRSWLLLDWATIVALMCLTRFTARRIVRAMRTRGNLRTRVVIVGASSSGLGIAELFSELADEGTEVMGFLDEYAPLGRALVDDLRVIGRPSELPRLLAAGVADEYILVPEALPHQRLEELSRLLIGNENVTVRLAAGSVELLTAGVLVATRTNAPLLTVRSPHLREIDAALKRAIDIAVSAAAVVVLAPVVAWCVAVATVRRQARPLRRRTFVGRHGGAVKVVLFEPFVSRWLVVRDMPALLAVLAGHLSLVGPRPRPFEGPNSRELAPITELRPGLTGLWRLLGAEATLEDQERTDLTYVRNYTFWEDIRIGWESLRRAQVAGGDRALGRWEAGASTMDIPSSG